MARAAAPSVACCSIPRRGSHDGEEMTIKRRGFMGAALAGTAAALDAQSQPSSLGLKRIAGGKPRNIIFILTDDHRYDAMGFLKGQSWLETPQLDSLARDGVH